jgi:hypothetical protein
MRKIIAYFFFFVACIYLSFSQNSSLPSTKNVFILNSYHITQGWVYKFATGYYPFINNESYNLFIEQLDEKRIPFSPEIGKMRVLQYNTLYQNIHFDIIEATYPYPEMKGPTLSKQNKNHIISKYGNRMTKESFYRLLNGKNFDKITFLT